MVVLLLFAVFVAGIIVSTIRRVKKKDYYSEGFLDFSAVLNFSFAFGIVIGLMVATGMFLSTGSSNGTTYINGIHFDGNLWVILIALLVVSLVATVAIDKISYLLAKLISSKRK